MSVNMCEVNGTATKCIKILSHLCVRDLTIKICFSSVDYTMSYFGKMFYISKSLKKCQYRFR